MPNWPTLLGRAAVSGTIASITSSAALASMAKSEGKGALQPVNATSHWLHGPAAAEIPTADLTHTGVGYTTHHAATFFWALIFETWVGRRRPLAPIPLVREAAVMSAVAAAVDYLATPKRFTPGWELVLSKRSMAVAYTAMALGLALGVAAMERAPRI